MKNKQVTYGEIAEWLPKLKKLNDNSLQRIADAISTFGCFTIFKDMLDETGLLEIDQFVRIILKRREDKK